MLECTCGQNLMVVVKSAICGRGSPFRQKTFKDRYHLAPNPIHFLPQSHGRLVKESATVASGGLVFGDGCPASRVAQVQFFEHCRIHKVLSASSLLLPIYIYLSLQETVLDES